MSVNCNGESNFKPLAIKKLLTVNRRYLHTTKTHLTLPMKQTLQNTTVQCKRTNLKYSRNIFSIGTYDITLRYRPHVE